MGRTRRLNLPGAPFHLTSRLQGHRPLFVGIESLVLKDVARTLGRYAIELLAYAVMPNHLHLVIVQGPDPLASFMQPLVRRLAVQVQQRHGCEGHVFERRYRSRACLTAEHLRSTLAYVNLNAVRAGMCVQASEYPWTSHGMFCGTDDCGDLFGVLNTETALAIFAPRPGSSLRMRRNAYRRYVAWRIEVDKLQQQPERVLNDWVDQPRADFGDDYWWQRFSRPTSVSQPERTPRTSLEAVAHLVIRAEFPGMRLEDLRSTGRSPALVRARQMTVARAHLAGWANHQIARYMLISQSTVSRIVCGLREDLTAGNGTFP